MTDCRWSTIVIHAPAADPHDASGTVEHKESATFMDTLELQIHDYRLCVEVLNATIPFVRFHDTASQTHQLYHSPTDWRLVAMIHHASCLLCEPCAEQSVDLTEICKHTITPLSAEHYWTNYHS